MSGITGKSGASPARFRHCEWGCVASLDHSAQVPGKVKRRAGDVESPHPPSQETYPRDDEADFLRNTEGMLWSPHRSPLADLLPPIACLLSEKGDSENVGKGWRRV